MIIEKITEVKMYNEKGECVVSYTPEEFFFNVKKKWYEKILDFFRGIH